MSAKRKIIELMEGLPDTPTFSQAFDCLRPVYQKEVAPVIARYNPPRVQDVWRRDITDPSAAEEQKKVTTTRTALVNLMQCLPDDESLAETVNAAAYELTILYGIELSSKQIAEGKVISHEEVMQRSAEWLK